MLRGLPFTHRAGNDLAIPAPWPWGWYSDTHSAAKCTILCQILSRANPRITLLNTFTNLSDILRSDWDVRSHITDITIWMCVAYSLSVIGWLWEMFWLFFVDLGGLRYLWGFKTSFTNNSRKGWGVLESGLSLTKYQTVRKLSVLATKITSLEFHVRIPPLFKKLAKQGGNSNASKFSLRRQDIWSWIFPLVSLHFETRIPMLSFSSFPFYPGSKLPLFPVPSFTLEFL